MTAEFKKNPSGRDTMSQEIAGSRNYYDWLFRTLAPRLGRKVLEIGPGWGRMGELIAASGRDYRAVDTDPGIIENLRRGAPEATGRFICADITAAETAALFPAGSVDTLLLMNVLEHIEDDVSFLKSLKASFPGCRLVLQLPALPALYGKMDEEAGHYRRYTARGARAVLMDAGYLPDEVFYFNFIGALTWFVSSRLAGFRLNSGGTGRAIRFNDKFIIPVSFLLEPFTRRLAGQSIIAVAR